MTELSRNLLNAAREGLAPDPDVAARVRARVAAAVGAGAVATPAAVKATTSATSTVTPVASTGGFGLAAKVGAALLVVGLAAVALVATRDTTPPQAPATVAPAAVETDEPTASRASSSSHEQAPAASREQAPVASREQAAAQEPTSDRSPSKMPAAAPRASLAREVELIDRAMLALRKQSPADALAAIATFDKETRGRGQMAEDAAAIALEAHCRLGHDVSTKLAAFDTSYPSSAQRSRIRDACKR